MASFQDKLEHINRALKSRFPNVRLKLSGKLSRSLREKAGQVKDRVGQAVSEVRTRANEVITKANNAIDGAK